METETNTTETITTAAPFAPGDRVTRRMDGAAGTVETVTRWDSETGDYAVAVRLDRDGQVWSGTEVAWQAVEVGAGCGTGSDGTSCGPAYLCPACIALLIDHTEHLDPMDLVPTDVPATEWESDAAHLCAGN